MKRRRSNPSRLWTVLAWVSPHAKRFQGIATQTRAVVWRKRATHQDYADAQAHGEELRHQGEALYWAVYTFPGRNKNMLKEARASVWSEANSPATRSNPVGRHGYGHVYRYTSQKEMRDAFWSNIEELWPHMMHHYRQSKRQNDYPADIRMAWVDFVDDLTRSNMISEKLAHRVTL